MHELALTQDIVGTITDRMGPDRVVRVRLSIGKLSGVVTESIRFAFDVLTTGTTLDGARLEIDEPPGRARCRSCAAEFTVDDLLATCRCGCVDLDVTGGDELRIREVEVTRDVRDLRV